ncbi:MAG: hypothetical protein JXB38_20570 [Anaerolineales bacterium]|nr:hypothetical protein [Anaerolineales bacterium]
MLRIPRSYYPICLLLFVGLLLVGCGAESPAVTPPLEEPAIITVPTDTVAPVPTTAPRALILLASANTDAGLRAEAQALLNALAQANGLVFSEREGLTEVDFPTNNSLVVALPPDPGLPGLVNTLPGVQFIAVGIPGLGAAPNLATIGVQGSQPDYQGFIAGYLAALITDEWRVGVLSVSGTEDGLAARTGFLTGAVYYCGLCNPAYPPFNDYPLYAEAAAGSDTAVWQGTADLLIQQEVETVFVTPGVGDTTLLEYLAQSGVAIIGTGVPPENVQASWVASIQPDYGVVLEEIAGRAMSEFVSGDYPTGYRMTNINSERFSPGRQANLDRMLVDLFEGLIDTSLE